MIEYRIYQTDLQEVQFCYWEDVKDHFSFDSYKEIHRGKIKDLKNPILLEKLYDIFNTIIPEGYNGRNLFSGDIVEIIRGDQSTYYFCDLYGWVKINK